MIALLVFVTALATTDAKATDVDTPAPAAATTTTAPAPKALAYPVAAMPWRTMIPLLVTALAAGGFTLAMKKRSSPTKLIRILESASLGPKRSLIVAKVGEETLVLGASEAGITLLGTQPAPETLLNDPLPEPAPARKATAPRAVPPTTNDFEDLLEETQEDLRLRRKLAAGLAGESGVTPVLAQIASSEPGMQLVVNGGGSQAVKLFLLLTALSFATSLLVSMTSFTRIVIVLSFLKQAMGTTSTPPNQVMIGLALAITGFVMAPTGTRVYNDALQPYFDNKIDNATAIERASAPVREFMLKQTREDDLKLFYEVANVDRPTQGATMPMNIVVPAYMVSELTTSFRMGLYVYLPFLLIDLFVASVLMSMGMMMVPPQMVSLSLKLGVFLLADGWHLLVASLVRSF